MSISQAPLDLPDIQGVIISGYKHLPFSCYLFLHCDNPAATRTWIVSVADQVTTAHWRRDGKKHKPACALNIAFTSAGLLRLGHDIPTFSEEFQCGITDPDRSRRLGDTGDNDPKNWDIGGPCKPEDEIDILLMLFGPDEPTLEAFYTANTAKLGPAGLRQVVPTQRGDRSGGNQEHFGFHDSLSQPGIRGGPKDGAAEKDCLAPGEFILGYENEYRMYSPTPRASAETDPQNLLKPLPWAGSDPTSTDRDLGRDGTYLVFRKLEQNVPLFRQYFDAGWSDPRERELMSAKFVGRWPSGTPLVLAPDQDNPSHQDANDFYYSPTDPNGYACPIGAHIRRSNPRDSLPPDANLSLNAVRHHRIIRRGTLYGRRMPPGTTADDGAKRGLLFFAVNADINRQFEFIQQTWVNNPKFNGLYTDRDPLIGERSDHPVTNQSTSDFTIQQEPVRTRLLGLPTFVTVKGGGYFFLPGIAALRYLAGGKSPSSIQSSSSAGDRTA